MPDLQIVIPTYRRMPRLATLGNLPQDWRERTTLVVDQHDYNLKSLYDIKGATLLQHPPEIDSIAKKRAWIIMQPQFEKIVMLDDDLRFAVRRPEAGTTKLFQALPEEVSERLCALETLLDTYLHAGWSARQGNNNHDDAYAVNTRQMFVLGYDCATIRELIQKNFVTLGRVRTREDMELTVQLLKLGWKNIVDFTIAADQVAGYAAAGGCTDERTVESSNDDAETFAALHPGIVKVVEKVYKGSVNRKEVVVGWKKAYGMSGHTL